MNGVHDMGGMHGFGPIEREVDEPTFHAAWEARVWALMRATLDQGYFNLDAFRSGIERMAPAEYLRASYYERWLTAVEYNLIQAGLLTRAEVDARMQQMPAAADVASLRLAVPGVAKPAPEVLATAEPPVPLFAVGDRVVTRNVHPTGHTRLPRYARGKQGVIHRLQGAQALPDTNAHGLGEHSEPVYNVRFAASELWGDSAEAEGNQVLSIDLWQRYLEPAPS